MKPFELLLEIFHLWYLTKIWFGEEKEERKENFVRSLRLFPPVAFLLLPKTFHTDEVFL